MKIVVPYTPREAFREFHESEKRFAALVCHRRAGKTVACINQVLKQVLLCTLPAPRGIIVAPSFAQAKDISWGYLKQFTRGIPNVQFHEAELKCTLPTGATIRLYGAENPERLRGIYADIAVFDEPASMDLSIWDTVVRPALSDRMGRAIFIGTPSGEDAFFDIYQHALTDPDWYTMKLKASESGILPQSELDAARKMITPEAYEREYEVSFSATFPGAFYAKDIELAEEEGRIRKVSRDESLEVYAAMDLGMDDATAIWVFQVHANEWRFIDYYENSGKSLDHYITWMKNLGYPIDTLFLPPDAKVRELGTGKSRYDVFISRGINAVVIAKHAIEDGINAVRMTFKRMWFDAEKCRPGIKALRNYRSDFDNKNKVLRMKPKHDKNSHSADGMRYAVMALDEHFQTSMSNWDLPISRDSRGSYV